MSFRLKSRNKLFKDLGKYDAICEFTEVAIREFISNSSDDFNNFLEEKAVENNIVVHSVEQNIFRSRISHSYIISVFQSFELFLREFIDDYSELYDIEFKLPETKTISLLDKIIQKISSKSKANNIIGEFRIETYEYYRAIRNKYAHFIIKDEKLNKAFNKINNYKNKIELTYPNLNAPNKYELIEFDDFILFSRTVKDIADGLCKLIVPDKNDIYVKYYKLQKQFNKFNNEKRKRNAIKHHFKAQFGKIENIDKIIDEIMVSLA